MTANHVFSSSIKKISIYYFLGIVIIFFCTFLIMSDMINRVAIDPEALVNFRFMRELTMLDIWADQTVPGNFVTYRPVKQSLLRIIYLVVGINPPVFFTINILLVGIVAFLIYEIVYRKTHEFLPALLAALYLLTDWRLHKNIMIIGEVQITLAAIFGLLAIWLIWFGKGKHIPIKVFLLLLLSALSKEFGVAFALAIFIDALLNRNELWKKLIGSAIGAVFVYSGIRLFLRIVPSSAIAYSSFLNRLKWYTYNILSGFIFSFVNLFEPEADGDLPTLSNLHFSATEAWQITFFQILPMIVFFILAFLKKDDRRYTIPLFFLLVGNSILFFWKYSYRFHFLGLVAIYIIVGFGINQVFKKLLGTAGGLNLLFIFNMLMTIMLLWRGIEYKNDLDQIIRLTDRSICTQESGFNEKELERCLRSRSICIPMDEHLLPGDHRGYYKGTDSETVRIVMDFYELPQEYCTCPDPYPNCE